MTITPDYVQKADDLKEDIVITLYDADGAVVDLTNSTSIAFKMGKPGGLSALKVDAAAAVEGSATNGQVRYSWQAADKDTPGLFVAEVQVTWSGGETQTFPDNGYFTILITRDL